MKRILLLGAALAIAAPAFAEVTVKDAWVRSTVAGQSATGAFMRITDPAGGRLVEAHTSVAGVAELHQMTMDGTTMKMRAVPAIDLAAGKTVELKPGGYHVMLMDLKQPLAAGDTVALTLVVEAKDKTRETIEVKATVRAPGAPAKH
jgi:periplasmic copper chaperone A